MPIIDPRTYGGTPAPVLGQDPNNDKKYKLAEAMLAQAQQYRPIHHPLQGIGQLAQALSGAYQLKQADQKAKDLAEERKKTFSGALDQLTGKPETKEQFVPDKFDDNEVIPGEQGMQNINPAIAPDRNAAIRTLGGSQDPKMQELAFAMATEKGRTGTIPAGYTLNNDGTLRIDPGYLEGQQRLAGAKNTAPSNIQEWQAYSKMSPAQKEQFLTMKRANRPIDLGGSYARVSQSDQTVVPVADKTLAPSDMPENAQAKAAATAAGSAQGRAEGEATASLEDAEASLPRLESVVTQLSDLGKKATYTYAGQAADVAAVQAGLDTPEGAIARREYIAKVDNEVLPLLRQTFGAAFTQKEGESLKATLGDVNASPAEKDAVLRSFIDSKREQVRTMRRRLGKGDELSPQEKAELEALRAMKASRQ